MKRFLTRIAQGPPRGLKSMSIGINEEVWQETDCTTCANCCRKMTPTLLPADRKRIAAHLNISTTAFETQYLTYDKKDKDWRMQRQPCVFLDLGSNKCTIYAVRPKDCAGFPHLTKSPMPDYMHVHKQNISYCPATFLFVEKLMERIEFIKP